VPELLRIEQLSAGYGESVVVDGVSLAIYPGECVALLGRNGVGKTTLLMTIMGLTQFHGGAIRWCGEDISRLEAHKRAMAGLGWVPQERRMWKSLTVTEHLTCVARPGPWTVKRVQELFPRLAERGHHHGSQLSGGEQQMLAIARALVINPKLLLLDEPMEGLAPIVVQELTEVLRGLAKDGSMSIILVEQHADLALDLAPRAVVMERGRIVHAGESVALLANREELDRWLAVS
jgi:branched-chain amino acid transport system ATP-binding protein